MKDLDSLYFRVLNLIKLMPKSWINVECKCTPRAGNRTKKQASDREATKFLKGDLERIKIEQPGSEQS
ncbi:MAG: hypothetical protein B7Y39_04885 [Bdellovibrio sp. 28-41-41]|nr:MAG: hypothetical protein B7Y39_04885 [Bdellovibrio sp. 28-41-41]